MASKNTQNPLNPCSFSDALTEKLYAQKSTKRKKLERNRKKLVGWLRKKGKSSQHAQVLDDKIESDGKLCAGRKGININPRHLRTLGKAVRRARALAKKAKV